ncbi:MAG TPA: hypothetical protein PKN27_06565 [Propionibacteriaceae bacterium]|nr:hypothetical protein [Propionibacteriaceae bacterium]
MSELQVRIRLDDDESLAAALEVAEANGASAETVAVEGGGGLEAQFAPVAAVLIGAAVVTTVKVVMEWWEKVRGGLVIDQREGVADTIHRDRDVPYGFVVIFPPDGGTVKVEVKDAPKDALNYWISEVISGAFKTVSDLAKAAKDLAGDGKVEAKPAAG